MSPINNRSKKDSILWMLRNGTPWFLKRSVDLLPAMVFLMAAEVFHMLKSDSNKVSAEIYFPEFGISRESEVIPTRNERVS
jgi:hypothetical protein